MHENEHVMHGQSNFWKNSFVDAENQVQVQHGNFGKMLNVMDTYGCNGTGLEDVDRSFIMCDPSFYNQTWANFTGVDGTVYRLEIHLKITRLR